MTRIATHHRAAARGRRGGRARRRRRRGTLTKAAVIARGTVICKARRAEGGCAPGAALPEPVRADRSEGRSRARDRVPGRLCERARAACVAGLERSSAPPAGRGAARGVRRGPRPGHRRVPQRARRCGRRPLRRRARGDAEGVRAVRSREREDEGLRLPEGRVPGRDRTGSVRGEMRSLAAVPSGHGHLGCDPGTTQRAAVQRPADLGRGSRSDPRGGPPGAVVPQLAAVGLRGRHRSSAAGRALEGLARAAPTRPTHRRWSRSSAPCWRRSASDSGSSSTPARR